MAHWFSKWGSQTSSLYVIGKLTSSAHPCLMNWKVGKENVARCVFQVILVHTAVGEPLQYLEEREKAQQTRTACLLFSSLFICCPVETVQRPWEVGFSSVTQPCPTLCDPVDFSTPSFPAHHQPRRLFKFMSIASVMPSIRLILCHPLFLPPSIFPSIRVFSKESALHMRWPKYWSFSYSNSPFNEYSGLISFRIDWFDLLAVQRTLKSLLQHHSSKHQFFGAQLSL